MSKQFYFKQLSLALEFRFISPIDRVLSGATNPKQSGPTSDGHNEALRIPQSSSITGTSPSDCLVSYPEHSLGCLTPLQRYSLCILQTQPTGHNITRVSQKFCNILLTCGRTWQLWLLLSLSRRWRIHLIHSQFSLPDLPR